MLRFVTGRLTNKHVLKCKLCLLIISTTTTYTWIFKLGVRTTMLNIVGEQVVLSYVSVTFPLRFTFNISYTITKSSHNKNLFNCF